MITKFILSILCLSMIFSLQAEETFSVEAKIVTLATIGRGGGLGINSSSPYAARYNASQELSKQCTILGGVIKNNSMVIDEAICGEVYSISGFKSRDCSAKAQALCIVIIQ